jgi:peptidoglycan/xylan/chitin deacetylase (PgdA/CDA1 family)
VVDIPEPRSLGYGEYRLKDSLATTNRLIGFDDGPNCSHNAFYEFLREQNQKATMFYIGSNVMDWPLQAQDAITDGHEICIHTWSHNYMTALTNEQAFAELYYTRKAIKLVTGVTPMCW